MKYFNYQSLISLAKAVQLLLVLLNATFSLAQHGIGTHQPNPQAVLEIQSPDKGVLLPKIGLVSSTHFLGGVTATASHTGMLVYNTNTATNTGLVGTGYYQWNGNHWEKFTGQDDLFWDLDRDTGVQVEENADDDTIRFDTDGTERMTITSSGTIGIGGAADVEILRVNGTFANTGGGRFSLQGGQNGGTGRGIHLWDFSSTTHGLYFGTAGAGKSFSGGTATAGAGFASHALRIRIYDNINNGVIFENSSEALLASISIK